MNNLLTILIAVISSGAFSTLIAAVISGYHDKKNENNAERKALMFLLASSIRNECQEYINDGDIDGEDMKRIEEAWDIYHNALGGNGFLDNYMKAIRKLPIKKTY